MSETLKARDTKDVEDAVGWAVTQGKALEILGRGSKRGLGRPVAADLVLDLSGLSGVTLYEPDELVLTAKAGTPVADIEALLDRYGQELAFEPMDYGPLLGTESGSGTLGGMLAANLSGPRRIKSGAARDHLLGAMAISGRGERFKSGGRVVKNVTGYDLCKLLTGSFGTLAVMTEVTVKVLPKAETQATLMVPGLDDDSGIRAMTAAMGSPCDVSAAAHLPAHVAPRFEGLDAKGPTTLLRLEGVAPSVHHRKTVLAKLLGEFGAVEDLGEAGPLWRAVRDAKIFAADRGDGERHVFRVSTPPAQAAAFAAAVSPSAQMFHDWAGGLMWIAVLPHDRVAPASIRAAIAQFGGHATLVRAPAEVRAEADVFQPQAEPVAALSRRIKQGFDPKGVLNPGRMWAGV